jgi:tetratricopeptide (TPR) repeat protein
VSDLAEELLALTRRHIGLAASAYITAELRAIGRTRAELDGDALRALALRARTSAMRFMDPEAARAFGDEIDKIAERVKDNGAGGVVVEHRLALNAAESLLARGDTHRALLAYRELAATHGDAASHRGVARAAIALGKPQEAMEALRDAALRLVKEGRRDEAISLLEEAVRLAPVDLAVHRRLVALYANAGDVTSSKFEHARFIGASLDAGDVERAKAELLYARETVGTSSALQDLERRADSPARPQPVAAPVKVQATLTTAQPPSQAPVQPQRPQLVVVRGRTAEERAVALIIDRDPSAADATLAAARELIAADKPRAASDLLLAHVSSGLPGREVQALLVDLAREIGREDIASEKCRLLARLLELDGDPTGASRMKRLAAAS